LKPQFLQINTYRVQGEQRFRFACCQISFDCICSFNRCLFHNHPILKKGKKRERKKQKRERKKTEKGKAKQFYF